MTERTGRIIGIDLGTTNSVLGVIRAGAPILLNVQGARLLPSVVGVSPQAIPPRRSPRLFCVPSKKPPNAPWAKPLTGR